MDLLIRFVLNALAVMVAAYVVPGIDVANFWVALIAALVIGIVNALVRPILLILTLPINIITLGLFTLFINALMFALAAYLVKGFTVANFTAAFFGALVFWIVSWFTNGMLGTSAKNK